MDKTLDKTQVIKRKPTLDLIASLAGVSKATVSRVLNDSSLVKPDVVTRVLEVIEEIGYVKKRKSVEIPSSFKKLTVVCDDSAFAPHTFYGNLLSELKLETSKLSIQLEMSMFNQLTSPSQASQRLSDTEALLILGNPNEDIVQLMARKRIPVVIINGVDPYMKTQSISPDYEFGGFMAADYLIQHGHRRIKILTANDRHSTFQRTEGFLRALTMAGVDYQRADTVIDFIDYIDKVVSNRGLVGKALITNPSGDFGAREILPLLIKEKVFEQCTAVFCICDMMALSLIEALSSVGIRVPEDISVIGFDNLDVGAISVPPLTTISTDYNKIAQTALHKLLTTISTPNKAATRSSVAVELIERGSVAQIF
ncbi:LacI family transcriptional regulator [Vibrio sp. DW001]|uniref:LacI family DNA-binding transcriptional regulator n=1 Tax=Vibrio sp. DW001 TaxID=2912315 RepID=UPI0023B1F52F|nr:LacI family DNA-binding transcriptional regulator [Vibrio sp. DW001]WED29777.1 LacI family transcriptional regulator [Vibrio sp. DW001]